MEPANKPSLIRRLGASLRGRFRPAPRVDRQVLEFLPDADEIEQRPLPRVASLTLHTLAAALVVFLLVATFSSIDLVVSARGRLITPLPNILVQPLDTSIIQKIAVSPGQIVRKGEILATLDPTFSAADETQLRTRLASLDTQRASLEAELAGKVVGADAQSSDDQKIQSHLADERQATYVSKNRELDENIARVLASLDSNRRDLASMTSRIQVLREMADLQQQLVAQRYAVRSRYLDAQDRLLEAERGAQAARSREVELQKQLLGLKAERTTFQTGFRQKIMEELLAVSREQDSVKEQLLKADKLHQLVTLTSPADAVVLEIAKLSPGSVARGTDPLFTLVPLGGQLEAEIQVESADVGYVRQGDLVKVKVDAYPFQLHGTLSGQLTTLSEDAFRRDNVPAGGSSTYYLGRVRLTQTQLSRLPRHARLLPGMTIAGEIQVGKRSLISYLLWPLVKAMNESVREP